MSQERDQNHRKSRTRTAIEISRSLLSLATSPRGSKSPPNTPQGISRLSPNNFKLLQTSDSLDAILMKSNAIEKPKRKKIVNIIAKKKQDQTSNELRKLRKRVIMGDFMNGFTDFRGTNVTSVKLWKFRQWELIVFVSSTFTDTRYERNILLDKILPQLKETALPYGINVTFVDMRWGVRDEQTVDHKTWIECEREIHRCRDESCGLFFLSLQSEKYGYRPLPRSIEVDIFDKHQAGQHKLSKEFKEVFDNWYVVDTNANPIKYVLKKLQVSEIANTDPPQYKVSDPKYFNEVLPTLRRGLSGIRFCKHLSRDIILGRSVSEWEAKLALGSDENLSRTLWIHRQFKGSYNDMNYCDTRNDTDDSKEAKVYLKDLKNWMTRRITNCSVSRIHHYKDIISHAEYTSGEGEIFQSYIQHWEANTTKALKQELTNIIYSQIEWNQDAWGMGIPGKYMEIFLHHSKIAHDMCVLFYGRAALLKDGMLKLKQPNRESIDYRIFEVSEVMMKSSLSKETAVGVYACISFIVKGIPGTGKSAFMSKLAQDIYEREIAIEDESHDVKNRGMVFYHPRPVFIRFCGTSDDSIYSDDILRSLRVQMEYVLGPAPSTSKGAAECSERDLFKALVKHHAVIILLDDIEEIVDGIEFLRNITLHPRSRIIVSTTVGNHKNFDQLFEADGITSLDIPPFSLPSDNEQPNEVKELMQLILSQKRRVLSESQWEYLMGKIRETPNALYVTLAARLVTQWPSSLIEPFLHGSVSGLLSQILDEIEESHGRKFTRAALGLITFSVRGLSDSEIEDLISYKDEVLYEVFQYDIPPVFRLPSHVWSKLKQKLSSLLVSRQHGCVGWLHEETQDMTRLRYSENEDEYKSIITRLAEYFSNIKPPLKNILSQPLFWPSFEGMDSSIIWYPEGDQYVNLRRLFEASEHLLKCDKEYYEVAVKELCSLEFVCAAVKCNNYSILIPHLQKLLELLISSQSSEELQNRVEDYLEWLQNSVYDIVKSPVIKLSISASQQPIESIVRQDYLALLNVEKYLKQKSSFCDSSWIRGTTLYFDPVHMISKCRVAWSPDSSKVAASLNDSILRIWNVVVNNLPCLEYEVGGKISGLQWVTNANKIWLANPQMSMWSMKKERLSTRITYPKIFCFAVSNNGIYVALVNAETIISVLECKTADLKTVITINPKVHQNITSVSWSRSDELLAISFASGPIIISDMQNINSPTVKSTFAHHTSVVRSVAWSPDGSRVASCGDDNEVYIWNPINASIHHKFSSHTCSVTCLTWNPDCSELASGSSDGTILIWNSFSGVIVCKLTGHNAGIQSLAWSPNRQRIVSAGGDNTIILWDSVQLQESEDISSL